MDRKCGCKGIRTCLLCEEAANHNEIVHLDSNSTQNSEVWTFCAECGDTAWQEVRSHPGHKGQCMSFPGITILHNFISEQEEAALVRDIDSSPWTPSQSGRNKQDFGPKVNFKKKKLKMGNFTGLPNYSAFLYERIRTTEGLTDFVPVELCNLEYVPERGSAIDPHFDDFWLWGERLVTVNLLSDTVLTMSREEQQVEVAVPLPRRSLIVVQGPARYHWKHAILRHSVRARRLATTLRELTPLFLQGGDSAKIGREIIDAALTFNGKITNS